MKQLLSHIDFLIQNHDCVIIPDFGGFVISHQSAIIQQNGVIIPPHIIVAFNPELRYNDGLIAESYMNVYGISYDLACKKLSDAVRSLNTILSLKQTINIGSIGTLASDEAGHVYFTPKGMTYCYAQNYGLMPLDIKRLDDVILSEVLTKKILTKRLSYKNIITGVGAVAAAVIVFFVTSTPIIDVSISNQKAGFFSDISLSNTKDITKTNKIEVLTPPKAIDTSNVKVEKISLSNKPEIRLNKENPKTKQLYYIIVGSTSQKSEAELILNKIKKLGYSDADIIHVPNRSRIYVATFNHKSQAEGYLSALKKKSKFNDAWIYTQNN